MDEKKERERHRRVCVRDVYSVVWAGSRACGSYQTGGRQREREREIERVRRLREVKVLCPTGVSTGGRTSSFASHVCIIKPSATFGLSSTSSSTSEQFTVQAHRRPQHAQYVSNTHTPTSLSLTITLPIVKVGLFGCQSRQFLALCTVTFVPPRGRKGQKRVHKDTEAYYLRNFLKHIPVFL